MPRKPTPKDTLDHHARNGLITIQYQAFKLFDAVESDELAEQVIVIIEQCRRICRALNECDEGET